MAHESFRVDARTTLPQLRAEWETCQRCTLGIYRKDVGGSFVFGEGVPGHILFIGEGPGKNEESLGRPFVGDTGKFLRRVMRRLSINKYYLTNAVCCRSWLFAYDTEGNQRYDREGSPVRMDEAPNASCMNFCRERLMRQIYIVDPILIVTFGASATEALLGKSVAIQSINGKLQKITIPGAGWKPSLTPKGVWLRKPSAKDPVSHLPVVQNQVEYNVLPVVHPAFAYRQAADQRMDSPMDQFMRGLIKARAIYSTYMQEVYGEAALVDVLTDDNEEEEV